MKIKKRNFYLIILSNKYSKMVGHIKIDRKILNWEWYSDYKMVHLFLHLLIKANWVDGKWRGQVIKRGQYMTSIATLSGNTGLTVSQIRTCLSKLQSTGEIANEMTNANTLITICKYETYQSEKNNNSKQNDTPLDKRDSTPNDTPNDTPNSNNIRKQEDKKVFINMPLPENFNGLPEIKIGAVVQLFKITKQTDISEEQVSGLWDIFKIQNLTGKKYYNSVDDVYSHFINWSKSQKIETNGTRNSKNNTTTKHNAAALELLEKGRAKFAAITGQSDNKT
jgi:hypothetical protein